jgi:hypothetical protein
LALKDARTQTQRLRAQLEQGHDPKIVRLLEKRAILKADSIESLFRQWHEAYCVKNKDFLSLASQSGSAYEMVGTLSERV